MTRTRPVSVLIAAALTFLAAAPGPVRAQDPGSKVLTVPDYARWRVLEDEGLSPDGRWATWVYRHTNVADDDEDPELHVLDLDSGRDNAIAGGYRGRFSPDSRWIAYAVDSTKAAVEANDSASAGPEGEAVAPDAQAPAAGGDEDDEVHHRIELRELATGATRVWHDVRSATFSRDSRYLLLRNEPARGGRGGRGGSGGSGGGAGGDEPSARGADAILVELATGGSQLLGSVADAAFNRAGTLLAYTVDAATKDANGVYVVDLATGATRSLDTGPRTFAGPAWSDDGTGLAVLRGDDVKGGLFRSNELVVVPDVPAALRDPSRAPVVLDTAAAGFPDGWVISEAEPLEWSEDGRRVFLGARPQRPASDTAAVEATDTTANVDVWSTGDRHIQSAQMSRAERERGYSYRQAFDVDRAAYVALSDSTLRNLEISPDGEWAVGRDERPYTSDWKPATADFYRVSTATGERTLMLEDQLVRGGAFGIAPDGRTFLYWKDDAFHAWDLDRGTTTRLGAGAPVFTDTTYDYPGPRPPWGVAGYTADGGSVIVEDRYDLWALPLDGGPARDLTGGYGAEHRVVLRLVRPEPIDSMAPRRVRTGEVWDLSEPRTLSAFGELTKKDGYYGLADGRLTEVVYDDARFTGLVKAAHADRFLVTRESFSEPPNLRVFGADLAVVRRITDSNPHHGEYRWGRSELFDFTDARGHPLQGMMWIPDDYEPGQKRPMLVAFYEKNTQNLHRYPMPELFVSMGRPSIEAVSRGYIVMLPDVDYHTGNSHEDQLDAVEAATRRVVELGYADPDRIGLHGHSYAGEGAAYIGTRSDLFAAVGEGAGVTDLYTDFSQEWGWSYQLGEGPGLNGSQYYMHGQGRWGVSPWDAPELYREQSALSHAHDARQPFLIMHGTADPTVSFNESLKFYNALRFNGKNAILLAYPGEGHHLDELGNRKDFTTRFFQFFGHWLRDEPAAPWMTEGVPFLEKGRAAEGPGGAEPSQPERGSDPVSRAWPRHPGRGPGGPS